MTSSNQPSPYKSSRKTKTKVCLKCGKEFESTGVGNRMCKRTECIRSRTGNNPVKTMMGTGKSSSRD